MNQKTHRDLYPEQYSHPLCGQRVVAPDGTEFVVERVMNTSFGMLVPVPGTEGRHAWAVRDLINPDEGL